MNSIHFLHRFLAGFLVLGMASMLGLTSCRDDDGTEPDNTKTYDKSFVLYGPGDYASEMDPSAAMYSLYVRVNMDNDASLTYSTRWQISSDVPWVSLSAGEGQGSALLYFKVAGNTGLARNAVITVSDPDHPEVQASLVLHQKANDGNATLTGNMLAKHAMGYGYNVMLKYASDSAFGALPILDYDKITQLESRSAQQYITEEYRYLQNLELYSANTYTELSHSFSSETDVKASLKYLGSEQDIKTFTSQTKKVDQTCSYIRLDQVVTSRTVDMGMISASDADEVFTQEFIDAVNSLPSSGDVEDPLVIAFIMQYGTHFCTSADLGGYIAIKALVTRDTLYTHQEVTKKITKRFLFYSSTSESSSMSDTELDNLNPEYSYECAGGSESAKQVIVASLEAGNAAPDLTAWQESMRTDDGVLQEENLTVVGTRTIPIYDLIRDSGKRAHVRNVLVNLLQQQSIDCEEMAEDEGYDSYRFDIPDGLLTDDSRLALGLTQDDEAQTSRVLLAREYVPAIRKDQLVEVAYPVVNGRPYLTRGIFLGDERHNPGVVQWYNNESSYEADTVSYSDPDYAEYFDDSHKLKQVYYYFHDLHVLPSDVLNETTGVQISYQSISDRVKVGPIYWQREAESGQTESAVSQKVNKLPTVSQMESLCEIAPYAMICNAQEVNLGLNWPMGFKRSGSSDDVEGTSDYVYVPVRYLSSSGKWEVRVARLSPGGSVPLFHGYTLCPVDADQSSEMLMTPVYCSTTL